MEVKRDNLHIGLVAKNCGFLSCEILRGIIFELKNKKAYDLLSDAIYELGYEKETCILNGSSVNIGYSLKSCGYGEVLDKVDVDTLLNKDFYYILQKNNIFNDFSMFSDLRFYSKEELNDSHIGFCKLDSETDVKKKIKRR